MSATTIPHDPNRGRWIPWVFVGGMALVVVVNAVLVFFALTTFTGLTTGKSYDRGRAYNQVLQEAARQEALGWTAQVALDGPALLVAVQDRDGRAVPGRVEGVLRRPLEGADVALDFASLGTGRFLAHAADLAHGQWEARLTLHGADGQRLDIRQRVIVR